MDEKQRSVRLDVPMPQDMVDYLMTVSAKFNMRDDRFEDFSRIVQAMIGVLIECDIDVSGCGSEEELMEDIKRAVSSKAIDGKGKL